MTVKIDYVIKGSYRETLPDNFDIADYTEEELLETLGFYGADVEVESLTIRKEPQNVE